MLAPSPRDADLVRLAHRVSHPVYLVAGDRDGELEISEHQAPATIGTVPALYPEWLGEQIFTQVHGVRFPYIAGEMANGIAGVELVSAMARAEMLAFFGAAGLSLSQLDRELERLRSGLAGYRNWGVNLIHQPTDPALEDAVAGRLLRAEVPKISISAFMDLTPAAVRCAAHGLRVDASGRIHRQTAIFAKVSRPEIAELFMSPPPPQLVRRLVDAGELTEDEGRLAAHLPVAEDITVEADSGGHTDGRPLVSVLPTILACTRRAKLPVRVGAAGGLGDPAAVAAAFALGAAYVVTGSINQMSVEAAVGAEAKAMLARAAVTDTAMAPAADMFELGAKVQVLRRETMFAGRAARLHQLYLAHSSVESMPAPTRQLLEREIFGMPVDEVWKLTQEYWSIRAPAELDRAQQDPKHRMALIFRWYLGLSTRWAIDGASDRRADYQLWCGPAAGAFNSWVADSFLADPAQRTVTQIARNLLQGAAVLTRVHQLRTFGLRLPCEAFDFRPRRLA